MAASALTIFNNERDTPGPYAVNGTSTYAVNNVRNLWGMQVANLKTGQIITATIPNQPPGDVGLLHGIGWTPDEREVWVSSTWRDPPPSSTRTLAAA